MLFRRYFSLILLVINLTIAQNFTVDMYLLSLAEQEYLAKIRDEGVRVGVILERPYGYPCFQPNCTRPGFGVELVQAACAFLQIPCEYHSVNHTMYGDNFTGEWRGMIRHIMDGVFDTSQPVFTPTAARLEVADFSNPVFYEGEVLITEFPKLEVFPSHSMLKGFSWHIWSVIVASLLLMAATHTVFSWAAEPNAKISKLFVNGLVNGIAIFSGRSYKGRRTEVPNRFPETVFHIWGLSIIVITGMYASQAVATSLNPQSDLPFHDLDSFAVCIRDKKCVLVDSSYSTSYFERLLSSTSGPLGRVNSALEFNQKRYVNNLATGLFRSHKTQPRPVGWRADAIFPGLHELFPPCTLTQVTTGGRTGVGFPLRKGSPLKSILDKAIIRMIERGVLVKMHKKYFGNVYEMLERCSKVDLVATPIPLRAVYGSVYFLLAGSVFGFMSLGFEVFAKLFYRKHTFSTVFR